VLKKHYAVLIEYCRVIRWEALSAIPLAIKALIIITNQHHYGNGQIPPSITGGKPRIALFSKSLPFLLINFVPNEFELPTAKKTAF